MTDTSRSTQLHEVNDWTAQYSAPHPPRKSSPLYVKTHHALVYVKLTPCDICALLPDHTGKFVEKDPGGIAYVNETHHNHIEDADFMGVDIKRVMADFPNWDWTKVDLSNNATFFNVGDAEAQMRVICSVHHRATRPLPDHRGILGVGIHHIPYPIWQLQRWQQPQYPLFVPDNSAGFDAKKHLHPKFAEHLARAQDAAQAPA